MLCDLEMLTVDTPRQLLEERHHDALKLWLVCDIQYLLHFAEIHNLLARIDLGPELEQAQDNIIGERSVLLQELDGAVRQLGMIESKGLGFVQRKQNTEEEYLVLLLERKSEPVDDCAQNFEQLGDAVMPLRFVDELVEDIVDRAANKCAEVEKFAVDAMESGLEEIAFPWIFRVEEVEQAKHEALVNIALRDGWVEVWTLDEAQEEFIDNLEV